MLPSILNEMPVPAMADKLKNRNDHSGYTAKYIKANIDDPTEMAELQLIETRGIDGNDEIILLDRDKFTFMQNYYIILHYLEKRPE